MSGGPGSDVFEAGMAMRRKTLGDAHVDRSLGNASDFDRPFQEFITEHAWGALWTRPGLEPRERSLLTLAILAALGREEELALHIRATANTGATPEEIREALLHVAIYAGVPAANAAMRVARRVLEEQGR
ncbi:MAG: 4-carboxymuconolactone decarboxylase [Minwuia sp.]|uniref:4-carboxymuconolactone decarboxylase n=1 Tax=Minwuia sp. TaxID=2493630 RepID=UPI003A87E64F